MAVQLMWGKRTADFELVHIKDAVRGIACGCVCPKCGTGLIARQGSKNTAHFAHEGDRQCTWAPETALHLLAKQIVAKNNSIRFPDGKIFYYDRAKIEYALEGMVADVWISNGTDDILVEIFVTHEITPRKEQLILVNGHRALEIDISSFERSIEERDLTDILINQARYKKLIKKKYTPIKQEEFNLFEVLAWVGVFLLGIWAFFKLFPVRKKRKRYRWA